MKIVFSTSSYCIDDLKKDFDIIKLKGLPCEICESYESNTESRSPDSTAIAFYGKKEISSGFVFVEVNPQYFLNFSEENRRLILLHEIIHACQRTSILSKTNQKYAVELVEKLENLKNKYHILYGNNDEYFVINKKLDAIWLFASWIFEIWDEMFLREKYFDLFEEKMKITFKTISSQHEKNDHSAFQNWQKYVVYIELVRSSYLQKICDGYLISSKYGELVKKWSGILHQCAIKEEKTFMDQLDSLTNIEAYKKNNVAILETSYDMVIQSMLDSVTV